MSQRTSSPLPGNYNGAAGTNWRYASRRGEGRNDNDNDEQGSSE
jgi:hypothetical protein